MNRLLKNMMVAVFSFLVITALLASAAPSDGLFLVPSNSLLDSSAANSPPGPAIPSGGEVASYLGTFNIVIAPGAGLSGNAPAIAAFERAAATWESYLSDPILVTIDADLRNLGASNVIGSASSVLLVGGYDEVRDQLVADSASGADEGIVSFLPTYAQASFQVPSGFGLTGNLGGTKANLKAVGFEGLDTDFGTSDGTIEFNSNFAFDFDRSDGITAGTIDFESVALHEIGHTLGFISAVDDFDFAIESGITVGDADIYLLDLYRFRDGGVNDPATVSDFTLASRSLEPGAPGVFDDLGQELAFSTGTFNGDGRQASHWKDGELTGSILGAMDPTIAYGQIFTITPEDLRAFDLIGWDIVSVPEPSVLFTFLLGPLALLRRRRHPTL